ncbi:MAG: magnesium transporter CorA, partial [Moraxellaceae bacterium]
IKTFSVAAVIFLPPTVVASFYGMNFQSMPPELHMEHGWMIAGLLMALSALLPYWYFRSKDLL